MSLLKHDQVKGPVATVFLPTKVIPTKFNPVVFEWRQVRAVTYFSWTAEVGEFQMGNICMFVVLVVYW